MVNTGHDQRTKKRPDMPLIINQRKSRPGMRDERRKKVRWEQGAGDGRLRNLLMIFFLFKKRDNYHFKQNKIWVNKLWTRMDKQLTEVTF